MGLNLVHSQEFAIALQNNDESLDSCPNIISDLFELPNVLEPGIIDTYFQISTARKRKRTWYCFYH